MPSQPAPSLIDSHVHTDDERLQPREQDVLQAARAANIIAQIVPGISRRLWPRVKALCDEQPDLYPCYGLHPCFHGEHQTEDILELAYWLGRERPVAVGECGLDYQIADPDKLQQQEVFAAQLALAREFDLPIVIHARKAVEDVIDMIRSSGHYRGMIHSYNGSRFHPAGRQTDRSGVQIEFRRRRHLRSRASPSQAGGTTAAGRPAAGNRCTRPDGCDTSGSVQRTCLSGGYMAFHQRLAS